MQAIYEAFRAHEVEYVTIGGVAVQAYGHPRTTQDIDILADPSRENLERLAAALRALGAEIAGVDAHLLGIDPADPDDLAAGANFTLRTRAGELDVWTDPTALPGARTWPELRAAAVDVHLPDGGLVRIVGRDDLIRMKHAAAALQHRPEEKRNQDRHDIAVLEAARRADERLANPPPERDTRDGPGHEIDS
ncbi:MAG: hypothetical protein ACR2KV_17490 [Solirubrobacteraceae bacterium]